MGPGSNLHVPQLSPGKYCWHLQQVFAGSGELSRYLSVSRSLACSGESTSGAQATVFLPHAPSQSAYAAVAVCPNNSRRSNGM